MEFNEAIYLLARGGFRIKAVNSWAETYFCGIRNS